MNSFGEERKPHFVLVPLAAQGHLIPMVDMARLLTESGVRISLITTPVNASRIKPVMDQLKELDLPIQVVEIAFVSSTFGLPEGCESMELIPRGCFRHFFDAVYSLSEPLEVFLKSLERVPDCMITDMSNAWTGPVARKFGIPREMTQVGLLLEHLEHTLPVIDCQRDLVDYENDSEQNPNECDEAVQAKKAESNQIVYRDKHGTVRFMTSGATIKDVCKLPNGDKVLVVCNRYFTPDRKSGKLLRSFCSDIVENPAKAPLSIHTWNNPSFFQFKIEMFIDIEEKFLYHVNVRRWVYDMLAKSWRLYKSNLKKEIFDKSGSIANAIKNRPAEVNAEQWQSLISVWSSEKKKKQCETNKANSRKAKYLHTLGRKSVAALRKEMMDANSGKAPDVLELYMGTHTKQDGSFLNEATREKMDQAKQARATMIENCGDAVDSSEIGEVVLSEVLGSEHGRRAKRSFFGPYAAGHVQKRVYSWTDNERVQHFANTSDQIDELKRRTEEQDMVNAALKHKVEEQENENAALRRRQDHLEGVMSLILGKEISRGAGSSVSFDVPNGGSSSYGLEWPNNQTDFPTF